MQKIRQTIANIGRHITGALFVLAYCMLALKPATASPIPSDALAQYEAMDEGERVRTLINLARDGHPDEAETLIRLYPLQGPHAENRTLYIDGLILKQRGKLRAATDKFRKALANDPKLTLVRSDLAETLYALEEDDGAKHHLQLLEAEAPDSQTAAGIRSFIDAIDTRRPYTINAYVSIAPTSNINSGTRNTKVWCEVCNSYLNIDDTGKQKSAFGLAGGINGSFNQRITDDIRAIVSGNIEGRIYDDKDYDSIGTSQAFELRRSHDGGYVSVGAISSQDFGALDRKMNYLSYGPRIAFSQSLSQQDHLSASAVYEWRDYRGSTAQDAEVITLDADLTHTFDSTLSVTATAGFTSIAAQDDFYSFDTWSGGVSAYREFSHGITLNLGGDLRYSVFDKTNVVAQKNREDLKLIGRIAVTKRDFSIFGIAPSLEYSYTWNNSNIALWDYDVHAFDLKFTKEF
jgi:outer membrane protein